MTILYNVEFESIDHSDSMDYSDAFISYAEHETGVPLTQDEIDNLDSGLVYELLIEYLY
jgi:hypothetical protein